MSIEYAEANVAAHRTRFLVIDTTEQIDFPDQDSIFDVVVWTTDAMSHVDDKLKKFQHW